MAWWQRLWWREILPAWVRLRRRIRRRLGILLRLRRITPRDGEPRPFRLIRVPELPRDTGGAYRPPHRPQDPAKDPREPYGGESSSRGQDHGWSGCTCSSAADALGYVRPELVVWGGDIRHRQGDLEGGTDLYDVADAFATYGEKLTIRSGSGWSALVDAHKQQRAIVIQGTGEVPGAGDFDGGHACCIGIETRASDGAWLFGDPLCTDWQWIAPAKIRDWAERWQSSIAFATTVPVGAEPEPEPEPEPDPEPCVSYEELELRVDAAVDAAVVAAGDAAVGAWLEWLRAPRPLPPDRWDRGAWRDVDQELVDELAGSVDPEPCGDGPGASWSRGRIPSPARDALEALLLAPAWDRSPWRAAAWAPDAAGSRPA